MYFILVLVVNLVCGSFSLSIADKKGYNPTAWFYACLGLGPVALAILALLPKVESSFSEELKRKTRGTGDFIGTVGAALTVIACATIVYQIIRGKWSLESFLPPNSIPFIILTALIVGIVRAKRQPLWEEAYRRLARNPMAMLSLGVICLYLLVAFMDSISWQDSPTTLPMTILDRLYAKVPQERTYSAPGATMTTGEPIAHPLIGRHLLGTDSTGKDIGLQTLKGCRTALIIGGFTSLMITPVAIILGMTAGYFGKWRDDSIQYVYTVFSSIPGIMLLIVLLLTFGKGLDRMCYALACTSWIGLCRLVRGETLKHRDREYVRAAKALGANNSRIMFRHILPNLLPIVIISVTLGFSGLAMQETILTYLGLGVQGTGSWGNMIEQARLELAREPLIWWNLASATSALFLMVLSFNVFGDALRDAIDPRLRSS
jgi:peptide/nickel transport system permease protein